MSSYFSEADKQQVAYCLGCLTWAVNCLKMFAEDGQDMPASLGLAHAEAMEAPLAQLKLLLGVDPPEGFKTDPRD